MFPRLTQMQILSPILSHRPDRDRRQVNLLEILGSIMQDATIQDYLDRMWEDGHFDRLIPAITEDLMEMRAAGELGGPIESEEAFGYLEVWNDFVTAGHDTFPERDAAAVLAGPLLAMVKSHAVLACTKKKNAQGMIRPRHVEGQLELDTIERRLPVIEAALKGAIAEGTSTGLDDGAHTTRQKNGEARVRLRAGHPIIEVKRKGAIEAWHEVELVRAPAVQAEADSEFTM